MQPYTYQDGQDRIGTQGGSVSANDTFFTALGAGTNGLDNNFGEVPICGSSVGKGDTAAISFWQNQKGQALIYCLDSGPTSTDLGNWLAFNFPNMYGANAGNRNLTGQTNAQVASLFLQLASVSGQKLDAQVLGVALAVYVTDRDLAGTAASKYGFVTTSAGTGGETYNVGSSGSAFNVANNTTLTVMDILLRTDDMAWQGLLYDTSHNGSINNSAETTLRDLANTVFSGLNQRGGIS